MPYIVCTRCGKKVKVDKIQKGQDYSTFVCDECQEAINQPAYKAEIERLTAKEKRTESENRRLEFLKTKIFPKKK